MQKNSRRALAAFLISFTIGSVMVDAPAWAGSTPFLITNRSSSLSTSDAAESALRTAFYDAADSLENTINTGFLAESSRLSFAEAMAKANASNNSSLTLDRASNPSRFSIGAGIQGGVYASGSNASTSANNSLPSLGVGAQAGLSLGVKASTIGLKSLGPINGDRLMLYLSGMAFSSTFDTVKVSLFNLGLNAQYQLTPGIGNPYLAHWGGIVFGTGLNYSTNSASYTGTLSQSSTTTTSGVSATTQISMAYTVGAKSSNFSVPLELSTNASLLSFLTIYGGGGVDLNFGSSSLTGSGSGPVTSSTTSGVSSSNLFSGTADLNLDDGTSAGPSLFVARGFGGLQFNLLALKVALQYNALSNGTYGGAIMTRFAL